MTSRLGALVLAGVLWATAGLASAQSSVDALIEEGIRLREERRDAEAHARFDQAWEQSGSEEALAQRGLAAKAMGRWVEAYRDLRDALASRHPFIEDNRGPLEGELAAVLQHVALLRITGPAGTRIRIDDSDRGALPLEPIPLPLRPVRVRAEPPGGDAQDHPLALTAGENTLVIDAPASGPSGTGGDGAAGAAIGLTVVGAVVLVAGAVLLGVGVAQVGGLADTPDGARPWDEVASERDVAYALEGAGIGGLALGGIVLGVGLGWLATGSGDAPAPRATLTVGGTL